ncbi:MAG: hypothetical protein ACLQU2_07690 [Candidatus Binataceae bacterium]
MTDIADHVAAVLKQCEREGLRLEVVTQLAEVLKQRCRALRDNYDMHIRV